MSKQEISTTEKALWKLVLELLEKQKDLEKEVKSTEAELKSAKEMYKNASGKDFDPADNLEFFSKEPRQLETSEIKIIKPAVVEERSAGHYRYDPKAKMLDKIRYALEKEGPMSRKEIIECLTKIDKKIDETSITQNFYSMVQRGLLTKPNGYGGKVDIIR